MKPIQIAIWSASLTLSRQFVLSYVGIKAPSAHQVFAKELTFTEAKVTTWVEFLEISELAGKRWRI